MNDSEVPHIEAECAECGSLFDLKFGTDCPVCHHTGVKWARFVDKQETSIAAAERAAAVAWEEVQRHRSKYPGILSSPYAHTEGDLKDIAELNHMFSLEDNR